MGIVDMGIIIGIKAPAEFEQRPKARTPVEFMDVLNLRMVTNQIGKIGANQPFHFTNLRQVPKGPNHAQSLYDIAKARKAYDQ